MRAVVPPIVFADEFSTATPAFAFPSAAVPAGRCRSVPLDEVRIGSDQLDPEQELLEITLPDPAPIRRSC